MSDVELMETLTLNNGLMLPVKRFRIFVLEMGMDEYEITDLYWFEENSVHAFEEGDPYGRVLRFRIEMEYEGKRQ